MSDDRHEPGIPEGRSDGPGGDHLESLLRLAGPREVVPADRMRRVKAVVRDEWIQETRARSRRISISWSLGALATAALILVGVRLALRDGPVVQRPRQDLAILEALSGAVRPIRSTESVTEPTQFQIGDQIREGDGVDTTNGGLAALRLASGASVRMDRGTRLRLLSDATMVLDGGAIYIDSGARGGAVPLEVRTQLGVVRDIGTRFEVRLSGSTLRVRVRDGVVRLSQSRDSHDARPGDELTLDGTGSIVRRTMPVYGADWAWAIALARPFDLEGRSLRDFLDWIAGENGWQLRFADASVEKTSMTTILSGSINGLAPVEALSAVLRTTGVEHRLDNGVLLIYQSTGAMKN